MAAHIPANFRRVITAAAGGNVIEWYDFYIFGSLAAILSVKFFEKSHPVAALLSTIALFTAGFLVRPLRAFLFGSQGAAVARTFFFCLGVLRRFFRGAQYGGAITYFAEHVEDKPRGYYTGWLQTSPTLG